MGGWSGGDSFCAKFRTTWRQHVIKIRTLGFAKLVFIVSVSTAARQSVAKIHMYLTSWSRFQPEYILLVKELQAVPVYISLTSILA